MICVYTISLIYEVTISYYLLRTAMNAKEFFDWATIYMVFLVTLAFIIPTIISIGCSYYLISVVIELISRIYTSTNGFISFPINSFKVSLPMLWNMHGLRTTEAPIWPHKCSFYLSLLSFDRLKYHADFSTSIYH